MLLETVRSDDEVVEKIRSEDVVNAQAPEMCLEILLPGIGIDWIWQNLRCA